MSVRILGPPRHERRTTGPDPREAAGVGVLAGATVLVMFWVIAVARGRALQVPGPRRPRGPGRATAQRL